jgi:type I restriction enzyme S subunit
MTQIVKIGKISTQIRGVSYSKNDAILKKEDGYLPVLRANNIQEQGLFLKDFVYIPESKISNKQKILIGDVVIAASSGSINLVGKAASAKENINAGFGAFCKILRPNIELVDPRYFANYFQTQKYRQIISNLAAGANINNLKNEHLDDLEIPLPPLSEQRRIASILDQADALRQKRQQAIQKLDQLLQATFIDMFGDPVSNPKGWDLRSVGEISESKLGKMLDKKKQSSEIDQYKYLRNANVQWFRFDLSDVFEMEFNEKDRKNCELKFGDVLVCEGGEPGRAAIWKNDLENCFFQKALHRVRLDMTQILPEYFVWLFWFYSKNGGFDDHITVATIAHLTGVKMKAMQIPIPPLSLQEDFQQKVNEIEVLKTTLENSSKLFESLFSSLQNQVFNGTL